MCGPPFGGAVMGSIEFCLCKLTAFDIVGVVDTVVVASVIVVVVICVTVVAGVGTVGGGASAMTLLLRSGSREAKLSMKLLSIAAKFA